MYCSKCGSQMAEGQRFCPNCGAPVPETAGGSAAGSDAYEGNDRQQYTYAPAGGVQQPAYGAVPVQKKQSALGIVALVLSFFIGPVALILAIIDLCKHDETEDHGCAIAGLVISIIFTLVLVFLIAAGVSISSELVKQASAAATVIRLP